MANGPGKYDELATVVREETQAECVAVVVIGGIKGSGFSVQIVSDGPETDAEMCGKLVLILRNVADDIEHASSQGVQE